VTPGPILGDGFPPRPIFGNPFPGGNGAEPRIVVDPATGSISFDVTNPNAFPVDDTFTLAIGDFPFDGGLKAHIANALAAKKKGKKKPVHEFKLAPVTVMVAPGKKATVKIPLSAAAKRFAKTHKTVSWAVLVKEADAAGNSQTFAAHGKVKVKSSKGKKRKKH
jgi:hypothetical protein